MKKLLLLILLISTLQLSASVWQKVNGPTVRKAATFIFNFNNQIFASTKEGMFIQEDDGNWINSELAIFDSTGIVRVFYQNNNVALISGSNSKQFVTYDYGENWDEIESDSFIMYGDESVVIVNETIFAQKHTQNTSLYKLMKNSKKWEKVYLNSDEDDSIPAGKLVYDGNYIFAGNMNYNSLNETAGSITFSSDNGKTWYKLDNFQHSVLEMVFHNEKLYVASSNNYIYRTSNQGINWIVDTTVIMPTDHFLSFGENLFAAVNNTANDFNVDSGLLMSSDDGVSWEKRNDGLDHINLKNIISNGANLIVLTDNETIFESTNGGKDWLKSKLLNNNLESKSLILDNDTLYTNTDFSIFMSTDFGLNWETELENSNAMNIEIKKIYKYNDIFVSVYNLGIIMYISTDRGKTWKLANIFGGKGWIGDILILADKIVVRSNLESIKTSFTTDYGMTWQEYDDPVFKNEYRINGLVRENNNRISVFTDNGILETTNNGIDWENIGNTNPPNMSLIKESNGVFYGTDSENNFSKSTDGGLNWETMEYKLFDTYGFDYEIVADKLVIPIGNGIKVSSDFGKTFEEYLIDTNEISSSFLLFNNIIQQEGFLIATSTEGVWRAKLSDLGIFPSSVESETERNYLYTLPPYPLPAKSEVKVFFYWGINLPMTVDNISIYNLNGIKIESNDKLKLEKQNNNSGNLIWDCSSVKPGIFLINIKHGTEEKSVKVVVE